MRSVVLLSGGLDSTVNFKLALDGGEVVLALTFDYGQRAAARERLAARRMCERFAVRHVCLPLPWLGMISRNALTAAERPLPTPTVASLDDPKHDRDAAAVWVANRNGIFVNVAAAYAEAEDAEEVVAGFNAEEAARFPDNSAEFIRAATAALAYSTRTGVRLVSHTVDLDKTAILTRGKEVDAPLDLIWSCYEGGEAPCGRCDPCVRLRRAGQRAGLENWLIEQGLLPRA